jgi:hypothetical protein
MTGTSRVHRASHEEDARGDAFTGRNVPEWILETAHASQEDVIAVIVDVLPPKYAKYGM